MAWILLRVCVSGGDWNWEWPCARRLVVVVPVGGLGGCVWREGRRNLKVGPRERIQVSPMRDVGVGPRLCRRAPVLEKVGALILGMQSNEWRVENLEQGSGLTDSSSGRSLSQYLSLAYAWERDGPAPGAVSEFVLTCSNLLE